MRLKKHSIEFQVVKRSEIKNVVEKTFHKSKSAGYKKLHKRATDGYAGLSKRQVLKCATTNENIRKFSVKFTNKAKPCPVMVKRIHEQHQVDLVDMKSMQVEHKGKIYRYILSLMDLFSRFHWLAPLERKKSSSVKKELQRIYTVHGMPERLQSDNGGEFKKDVEKFCEKKKIKMIRCRPYNPKAQGKVERSHRVLRRKIYYDLMKQKKTGVNWVKSLPEYMKCLNHDKREELSWKSAFEIYFGRKANELVTEGEKKDKTIYTARTIAPSTKDFRNQRQNTSLLREKASKADKRMAQRMMEKDARKNIYKTYESGDKVFVRVGSKRRGSTMKHRVLAGKILKRNKNNATYKVQFRIPGSEHPIQQKFRVEDIADRSDIVKGPKKDTQSFRDKRASRKNYQQKLRIPLTRTDRIEQLTEQGYVQMYDPPGDGNCQFSALCFALRNIGFHRTAETLRTEVVNYLTKNDMVSGVSLGLFAGIPWQQYLQEMARDGTYGDEITLRAISNIFNVEITIVSTLGQEGRVEIFPENTIPFERVILGHFAEGQGDHYITLDEVIQRNVETQSDTEIFDNQTEIDDVIGQNVDERNEGISNSITEEIDSQNDPKVDIIEQLHKNLNLEQLPLEILEKIFLSTLISSDFTFPNHVCWSYNNMLSAVPIFKLFEKKGMDHLPRVYIDNPYALPKPRFSGETFVNMQRIIRAYGSSSGIVTELKRIISSPKWNTAWISLFAEAYGWYMIKNVLWKSKKK